MLRTELFGATTRGPVTTRHPSTWPSPPVSTSCWPPPLSGPGKPRRHLRRRRRRRRQRRRPLAGLMLLKLPGTALWLAVGFLRSPRSVNSVSITSRLVRLSFCSWFDSRCFSPDVLWFLKYNVLCDIVCVCVRVCVCVCVCVCV